MDEATAREWVTSLGRREAIERLSHLFCELTLRLRGVGLTEGEGTGYSFHLPPTQEQLGDAAGLSTVHVNRTLQELREQELIILKGKTLTIPDLEALKRTALFNPNYLHFERVGQEFDANDG